MVCGSVYSRYIRKELRKDDFARTEMARGSQILTALMYSIGMFDGRDGSLIVSLLSILKPERLSSSQSCFSGNILVMSVSAA